MTTPEEQKREMARVHYERFSVDAAERTKYQVDLAQATLRGLTIINGGAIVALFTLIGNKSDAIVIDAHMLKWSFGVYILGLMLTLTAGLAAFMSQYWYFKAATIESWHMQADMLGAERYELDGDTPIQHGNIAIVVGLGTSVLSLICFGIGSWLALSGVLAAK